METMHLRGSGRCCWTPTSEPAVTPISPLDTRLCPSNPAAELRSCFFDELLASILWGGDPLTQDILCISVFLTLESESPQDPRVIQEGFILLFCTVY